MLNPLGLHNVFSGPSCGGELGHGSVAALLVFQNLGIEHPTTDIETHNADNNVRLGLEEIFVQTCFNNKLILASVFQ